MGFRYHLIIYVMDRRAYQGIKLSLAALFLSGFSAIIFQEIWMKKSTLLFGHTTYAITAVLCVFMLGLSLGSFLAPTALRYVKKPFLLYAIIEGMVGTTGLLLTLIPWSKIPVSMNSKIGFVTLFLIPTTLMGMTTPIMVGGIKAFLKGQSIQVARVYFLNTLGAATGAIVGAFLVLPSLGTDYSAVLASTVLVIAMLLTLPLWKDAHISSERKLYKLVLGRPIVVFAAFFSGVIGLSQEVIWSRLLSLIFGPSVYAFGSILFIYLIGIAIGSALAHRYRKHLSLVLVAWNFAATGFATLIAMSLFSLLPFFYVSLIHIFHVDFLALRVVEIALGGLILLPLAIAQGFLLPNLVALIGDDCLQEEHSVAVVFGSNTLGCILGALSVSLWFIPTIGILNSLFVLISISLILFLILVPKQSRQHLQGGTIALVVAVINSVVIYLNWDRSILASGIYKYAVREVLSGNTSFKLDLGDIEYFKEGLSSTVAVFRTKDDLLLSVDGKVDASMYGDLSTQTMLAALPMSLVKSPREALVIGLASGVTSGTTLLFDDVHVTTVEIEPAVIDAHTYFSRINHEPMKSPRHQLLIDDARNFLRKNQKTFDIITSEPSNPWMSGIAPLFTLEFFQLAAEHLTPQGVMCQWLPLYGMTTEIIDSIILTYSKVFKYVYMFESVEGFDVLLIGSQKKLILDPRNIGRSWNEQVRANLQNIQIDAPEDMIGLFLSGPAASTLPKNVRTNTDKNGFVEYRAPRAMHLKTADKNHEQLILRSEGIMRYLPTDLSKVSFEKIKNKIGQRKDSIIFK
ncbi:MAG: hypothetical protein KDD48_03075 [Bdellovibrionales bacterium]|nr:hypothetical protein [Bdellovibrionales bacterium]